MNEPQWQIPEPEVFGRYLNGEELSLNEHTVLQSYLMARCLQEAEHICNNTQMQLVSLGEVLEKVGDGAE